MKVTIEHPSGHPYILFANEQPVDMGNEPDFILATDEYKAKLQAKAFAQIRPVDYFVLKEDFDTLQINKFLKQFGTSWIVKAGRIYYSKAQEKHGNIRQSAHSAELSL